MQMSMSELPSFQMQQKSEEAKSIKFINKIDKKDYLKRIQSQVEFNTESTQQDEVSPDESQQESSRESS